MMVIQSRKKKPAKEEAATEVEATPEQKEETPEVETKEEVEPRDI